MALPTNDDFANSELSIEELDAIAAGISVWGKLWRDLKFGFEILGGAAGVTVAGGAGGGLAVGAAVLRRVF